MTIVYRKTAKGIDEIKTRACGLVPRVRSALILVDGHKTNNELERLILADPAGTLASLLADGFIEVLATMADQPARRPAEVEPAPSRKGASGGASFESLRRDAAHYLNDHLGPAAETIAIKIERARSMAELQPLLVQGMQTLRTMRGATIAEVFAARFIAPPDA